MGRMQAVYYRDLAGTEPVNAFIDRLYPRAQDEIDWHIELLNALETRDPPLAFPHSSQVRGELRELRCHYGRCLFRILYRRSEALFILLHAFEKRSGTAPEAEVAVAERRWDDYKARMDARPREGIRPAGRDAP